MRKNRYMLGLVCEILLGALVLAIVAGLGTAAYAASANGGKVRVDRISFLDPFTLSTVTYVTNSASNAISSIGAIVGTNQENSGSKDNKGNNGKPPVWVPRRPPFRSGFRPRWWPPGKPPWVPPGPT